MTARMAFASSSDQSFGFLSLLIPALPNMDVAELLPIPYM
jgi:hypothetical protein